MHDEASTTNRILDGRVALVTGCASPTGIGHAIALHLALAGADIAIADVKSEESRLSSLAERLDALGVRTAILTGDVGSSTDVEQNVNQAIEELGHVDILVNNAGTGQGRDRTWTWEVPEDAFDDVMRVNTKGVFLMSAAVTRHLLASRNEGRIINMSSGFGRQGQVHHAAYCASKFAVVGLTQSMAKELAPHRITVNAVCPGPIATGRRVVASAAEVPVGRLGHPDDIARVVVFLADPASSFITGECINVNGGIMTF